MGKYQAEVTTEYTSVKACSHGEIATAISLSHLMDCMESNVSVRAA